MKMPERLKGAVAIFTLVGGVAAWLLPYVSRIFGMGSQPNVLQLALTGVVLIALTAPLLNYVAKILGFNRAWFLLALTYNGLIIIIKFFISPLSLYSQIINLGVFGFDPNITVLYVWAAVVVMLIYAGIFTLIYWYYRGRAKALIAPIAPSPTDVPKKSRHIGIVVAIIFAFLLLTLGSATGFLFIPLFFGLPGLSYIAEVFGGALIFLLIAVGFAIFTAIKTFDEATKTAVNMKDATLLATFFWLGLSMILIYHVFWIVYMSSMATIWPFRTLAPSK